MAAENQRDMDERKQEKELRDHLWMKGSTGARVSNESIKHRNVLPKDARRGNLVVLDVRSAGNLEECVLGPWEKQYMIGLLNKRPSKKNNLDEDILEFKLYEPYYYDSNTRESVMPMWAALKQNKVSAKQCTCWRYLLGVPWLPINQMPLSVHKALYEANGEDYTPPAQRNIMTNFKGSGVDVVKLGKEGYVDRQKASTIKFVMMLDNAEKPSLQSASAVILAPETQDELLLSMIGPILR